MLPSVREIIRQVEEMTIKNNNSAHNSTTSLSRLQSGTSGGSQHVSRSLVRPVNADQTTARGAANRSQSASSSFLSNGRGVSRLNNHNGVFYASEANNSGDVYADPLAKGVR